MAIALYAAFLALIQVALTANIVKMRYAQRVSLGTEKGDGNLLRGVRAHGNFIEIVPIALILILLAELQGAPLWCVHSLGMMLVAGRGLHIYALFKCPDSVGRPRVIGMVLSLMTLILGALLNLWVAVPSL